MPRSPKQRMTKEAYEEKTKGGKKVHLMKVRIKIVSKKKKKKG